LGGTFRIAANGAATVQEANPRLTIRDLHANVAATGIAAQGKSFGDLTLVADTSGSRLNATLHSNLASAAIEGRGSAQLTGDYPVDAQVTFRNVTWSRISEFIGRTDGRPAAFEAVTEGQVSLNGPVTKTASLRGSLEISRLQFSSIPGQTRKQIVIQNQGP